MSSKPSMKNVSTKMRQMRYVRYFFAINISDGYINL